MQKLFWWVLLLLIFIPLYPKFPAINIKGTFVAIRIEDLLIALTFFIWLKKIFNQYKEIFSEKLIQLLLVFFFIGAVSLFSGIFLTKTVSFSLAFFHYFRRIEFMLLLPIAYYAISTRKQIYIALVSLSFVLMLVDIYALGQKYLDWPVISTTNSEFSKGLILYLTPGARVNSTFAGHYDLAIFLTGSIAILVPLSLFFKNLFYKIWTFSLFLLSFLILVLTAARVSFIATLLGVLSALILTGRKVFTLFLIILAILALIYPSSLRDRFISTIKINLWGESTRYSPSDLEHQLVSQFNIQTLPTGTSTQSAQLEKIFKSEQNVASDITPGEPTNQTELEVFRSYGIRINVEWPRAIRAFLKNPLLGTGYSSLGLATDNDFLRSLGEVGLLGTFAFILIMIEIIKRVWRIYRSNDPFLKYFSAGMLSMILAFLINGLFIDLFEASKVAEIFWLIVGINLAAEKI